MQSSLLFCFAAVVAGVAPNDRAAARGVGSHETTTLRIIIPEGTSALGKWSTESRPCASTISRSRGEGWRTMSETDATARKIPNEVCEVI
jgi:hypothetical protein